MSRTLILGDIHACLLELEALLREVQFNPDCDRLISLGDVIDRGPSSSGCVDLMMQYGETVLGNHCMTSLKYWHRVQSGQLPNYRNEYHRKTADQLVARHYEWMERLPAFITIESLGVSCVHAGALPFIPLEDQCRYTLCHIGHITEPTANIMEPVKSWWTSKAPPGTKFWGNYYTGHAGHLLVGHIGVAAPIATEHVSFLDTGCCFGRTMTACVIEDDGRRSFVSVPAEQQYAKGRYEEFEVMPGVVIYS